MFMRSDTPLANVWDRQAGDRSLNAPSQVQKGGDRCPGLLSTLRETAVAGGGQNPGSGWLLQREERRGAAVAPIVVNSSEQARTSVRAVHCG
jgi:hypothetical protein